MPDMLVKLYELPDMQPAINAVRARGVVIRRAMAYDKTKVTEWVRKHFGEDWASEADVAFCNDPISCHIAIADGLLAGFACYDATYRNFFGPTGVATDARGRGIGAALLLSCLHAMAGLGYGYAIIGGVGPAEFYRKTVGAIDIPGSSPGIYRDALRKDEPS